MREDAGVSDIICRFITLSKHVCPCGDPEKQVEVDVRNNQRGFVVKEIQLARVAPHYRCRGVYSCGSTA